MYGSMSAIRKGRIPNAYKDPNHPFNFNNESEYNESEEVKLDNKLKMFGK